jgi:hypothetical protein
VTVLVAASQVAEPIRVTASQVTEPVQVSVVCGALVTTGQPVTLDAQGQPVTLLAEQDC